MGKWVSNRNVCQHSFCFLFSFGIPRNKLLTLSRGEVHDESNFVNKWKKKKVNLDLVTHTKIHMYSTVLTVNRDWSVEIHKSSPPAWTHHLRRQHGHLRRISVCQSVNLYPHRMSRMSCHQSVSPRLHTRYFLKKKTFFFCFSNQVTNHVCCTPT